MLPASPCCPGGPGPVAADCAVAPRAANHANQLVRGWLHGRSTKNGLGRLYDGRMPVASVCEHVDRLGARLVSQAKVLCNATQLLAPPCVVVSIGSENIWDFERDVVRWAPHCTVHVFDCTGAAFGWRVPDELRAQVTLHFRCLGAPRWTYAGVLKGGTGGWLAPRAGQAYEHVDWPSLLASIGLNGRPPSLLKIDCEGCEVDVFRSLLEGGGHRLLPDQIAVELHYPYERKNASIWFRRFGDLFGWPADAMATALWRAGGYSVINHVSGDHPCCQEVLLARTRCTADGVRALVD